MTTTLDPANINSPATLSNGNKTITTSTASYASCISTTSKTTGKWWFEVTINSEGSTTDNPIGTTGAGALGVGIAMALPTNGNVVGTQTSGAAGFDNFNEDLYHNNTGMAAGSGTAFNGTGGTLMVCLDCTDKNVFIKLANGNYDGNSGDNPASNTGGFNGSSLFNGGMNSDIFNGSPIFACVSVYNGSQLTVNFGASAPANTPPAGYNAWDGSHTSNMFFG